MVKKLIDKERRKKKKVKERRILDGGKSVKYSVKRRMLQILS